MNKKEELICKIVLLTLPLSYLALLGIIIFTL